VFASFARSVLAGEEKVATPRRDTKNKEYEVYDFAVFGSKRNREYLLAYLLTDRYPSQLLTITGLDERRERVAN
jgi:hypothetical protein